MEIKLVSCPVCTVAHFQNVIILRNALINVTKKPLVCPVCAEILLGLDKFTIHLFTHGELLNEQIHSEVQHCDKPANNGNHDTNNNGAVEQIPENTVVLHNSEESCQLEIPHEENVAAGLESAKAHCDICNFEFSDSSILEMHNNLLHSNGFSCHLCQKKFKMHGSLMVHMRVAHYGFKNKLIPTEQNEIVDKSPVTPPIIDSGSPPPPPAKNENKQWECDVCLKRFTTKYFLKKHKRLHTGEMPYECTLCSKSFTFQQSYHKHMLYHSSDKPHTCAECGRSFKELSTLHNHERIHSGERPFGCEICGKRFRQRVSYLVHKRIHTGAMPYKCTSCDKSFRYKVSQRTHKCKAQPPGSVVRQFGDLVQKLLQNRAPEEINFPADDAVHKVFQSPSPEDPTPTVQDPLNEKQIEPCPDMNTDFFGLVMSPTFQITSDQFESLCLSSKDCENHVEESYSDLTNVTNSPSNHCGIQECSTINEECFKQLLYNTTD